MSKCVLAFVALFATSAVAERLPIRAFRAVDGLGHDHVRCALRDAQDFLWFCTAAGIARFDGQRFERFGIDDGLPAARVHAAAQTPDGSLFVATERGVARLAPAARGGAVRFEAVAPGLLGHGAWRALHVDDDGSLLAGGEAGARRIRFDLDGGAIVESVAPCGDFVPDVRAFERTADGTLWIGGGRGRLAGVSHADDCVELEVAPAGLWVRALAATPDGALWIGSDAGLARLDPLEARSRRDSWRSYGPHEGFAARRVRSLFPAADGALWVGAVGGIFRFDGSAFLRLGLEQGLPDDTANGFTFDREGQLWLATDAAGVVRYQPDGFRSYDRADGLGHVSVGRLFAGRDGALHVGGEVGGWISRFDGERFRGLVPRLPEEIATRVAASKTWPLEDHRGEWWLATVAGLLRYPRPPRFEALARTSPSAHLGVDDGLASDWAYLLHESSRGELWVATAAGEDGSSLTRLDATRALRRRFGPRDGLPAGGGPSAFAETADGTLYVGWSGGELLRFAGERFELVAVVAGAAIQGLLATPDALWIGTAGAGARRLAQPVASIPVELEPQPADLSHEDVRAIARDPSGELVLATSSGAWAWRAGERARRFDTEHGLAALETSAAFVDRDGALWIGTFGGLSRRSAGAAGSDARAVPIWIRSFEVDGAAMSVSALGERFVGPIALPAGSRRLHVSWFGPAFAPGVPLVTRHRIVGVDPDWNLAGEERSLAIAGLAPGSYRFEVAAVRAPSEPPGPVAAVEWTIAAPFWRRSWFVLLAAAAIVGVALVTHQLRIRRLEELARVRARIAGDLHDDLSASLTRISMMSELGARRVAARERGEGEGSGAAAILRTIGGDARELLDSTRDLVWAIDPRDETAAALAARLRAFLDGVVDADRTAARLDTEGELARLRLSAEVRRNLLFLLKEAIHNAVRHAGASRILVRVVLQRDGLVASVEDDGRGFDPPVGVSEARKGRGLDGMRARAAAIGARFELRSAPGAGTIVRCEVGSA